MAGILLARPPPFNTTWDSSAWFSASGGQAMTTENERLHADHHVRKHAATQWDWRKVDGRNYITPSQDQGACQASTGFAVADTMNAKLRILFKIAVGDAKQILVPDLSAADVFYCGGG